MTPYTRSTTVIALMLCMALPAWGQQYLLYAPQPVTPDRETPSQEGVLVKEIEIRKGDTLYGLSRKFNGRGKYYPQILLFNTIKNPDLIYAGNKLRVPLSHKEPLELSKSTRASQKHKAETETAVTPPPDSSSISRQNTELSSGDLKGAGSAKIEAGRLKKKSAAPAKKGRPPEYPVATDSSAPPQTDQSSSSSSSPAVDSAISGQKLFEAAVSSYRRDDCRTALEQFDRYLADNSDSPLAADASLYKADCYLKLSAQ